jgi:hypothetical protein
MSMAIETWWRRPAAAAAAVIFGGSLMATSISAASLNALIWCDHSDPALATVVFQSSYKRVLAVSIARLDLVFIARVEAGAVIRPGDICMPGCRPEDLIILSR